MNNGWIRIHRGIQQNSIWEVKPFSPGQAWIDLLLRANHSEKNVLFDMNLIKINRGQFITSSRKLAENWGWSRNKVNQFLDVLKQDKMIDQQTDHKKTTITILKYDSYQKCPTSESTTEEPLKDTNNNEYINKKEKTTVLNLPNMKVVLNKKKPLADSSIVINALKKIGLAGNKATEIYQQYGKEYLIRKIYLYEYTVIFRNGKIGKPLAWIQNAIKEDYEESDQYLEWLKDKKETTLNNPKSSYELKALAGLI